MPCQNLAKTIVATIASSVGATSWRTAAWRRGGLDVERTSDTERPDLRDRRRRRRTLQRCSVVLAALSVGATQCDPGPAQDASGSVTVSPTPVPAAAPAVAAAPPAAATPVVSPHAAGADVPLAIAPTPASASAPEPVRIPGPDGTSEPGRCTQYEDLLMIHAPEVGWDALRMSKLAWRESNCWAAIRSRTSDTGLLQINDITLSFLNDALGEPVDRWTLTDPVQNIRAAAALCTFWETNGSSCYQPWRQN